MLTMNTSTSCAEQIEPVPVFVKLDSAAASIWDAGKGWAAVHGALARRRSICMQVVEERVMAIGYRRAGKPVQLLAMLVKGRCWTIASWRTRIPVRTSHLRRALMHACAAADPPVPVDILPDMAWPHARDSAGLASPASWLSLPTCVGQHLRQHGNVPAIAYEAGEDEVLETCTLSDLECALKRSMGIPPHGTIEPSTRGTMTRFFNRCRMAGSKP
jgi:hypothetical protein